MLLSLAACGDGDTVAGGTGTGGGTVMLNPGDCIGSDSQAETIPPVLADLMTPLLFVVPSLNEAKSVNNHNYRLGWKYKNWRPGVTRWESCSAIASGSGWCCGA